MRCFFNTKNYVYSTVKEEDKHMSDFTPIETQEAFDKAIQKRLAQKDRELADQYKDYLSPDDVAALKADYENKIREAGEAVKAAEGKIKEKEGTVSELTKRAESAEADLLKNRIAYENRLPLELASRLVGSNEEELKKDAETLAGLMKPASTPPLHTNEPFMGAGSSGNQMTAGMASLLSQLKNSME